MSLRAQSENKKMHYILHATHMFTVLKTRHGSEMCHGSTIYGMFLLKQRSNLSSCCTQGPRACCPVSGCVLIVMGYECCVEVNSLCCAAAYPSCCMTAGLRNPIKNPHSVVNCPTMHGGKCLHGNKCDLCPFGRTTYVRSRGFC